MYLRQKNPRTLAAAPPAYLAPPSEKYPLRHIALAFVSLHAALKAVALRLDRVRGDIPMNSAFARFVLVVLAILPLASCGVQRYRAAPLVPAETASTFWARSLNDSGFAELVEKKYRESL